MCSSSIGTSNSKEKEMDELSGWEAIRDFFTSRTCFAKEEYFDVNSFVDNNIDDINNVLAVEKVQLKLSEILKKNVKCPLCDFETRLTSKRGLSVNKVLIKIKNHLLEHQNEIEETTDRVCPICDFTCSEKYMRKHYRLKHPDDDVPDYSNEAAKKGVLASLLELIDSRSKKKEEVRVRVVDKRMSKNSYFHGYKSRVSLRKFHELLVEEFDKTQKFSVLFQYKVVYEKKMPYSWACGLCENESVGYLPHRFKNDLSLRLYVLRHFAVYHPEEERITKLCDKEWENLRNDTGLNLERYKYWSTRFEKKNRSTWLCLEPYNDENKDLMMEMIVRDQVEYKGRLPCETVLCLLCFNPMAQRKYEVHFNSDTFHRLLNSHPGKSEFVEIEEIAEFNALDLDIYPMGLLRYSKMFCLTDYDSTNSVPVYKWRCALPCEEHGHISDVLHFPSRNLLLLYVLKHFLDFHPGFFCQAFIDHEWRMLRNEFRIAEDLLHIDPLKEKPDFELDDPNDYQWPIALKVLPRTQSDFKVCFFCFWCGLPDTFLDHISIHGYIQTTKRLSLNAHLYDVAEIKLIKKNYVPVEVGKNPNRILGPMGKCFKNTLRVPNSTRVDNVVAVKRSSISPALNYDIEDRPGSRVSTSQKVSTEVSPSSVRSTQRDSARTAMVKISQSLDDTAWKNTISDTASTSSSSHSSVSEILDTLTEDTEDTAEEDVETSKTLDVVAREVHPVETRKVPFSVPVTETLSHSNTICSESRDPVVFEQMSTERISMIRKRFEAIPVQELPQPTFTELKALELMKQRRCFLCKGNSLIRVPGMSTVSDLMTENCVFAHYILRHSENETVKMLVERKRAMLLSKEPFNPTPFLLETKGALTCSSCASKSDNRFSVLFTHFISCSKKSKTLPTPEEPPKYTASTVCRLKTCGLKIRAGNIFHHNYTQLFHLLNSHAREKEAFELASKMKEEFDFAENVPFLDVSRSFVLTLEKSFVMLACSKCDKFFHKPQELAAHSDRYHSSRKSCPYKCSDENVYRKRSQVTREMRLILHILSSHYDEEDVLSHFNEQNQNLCKEAPCYRVDIAKSVEESRLAGCSSLVCYECKNVVKSTFRNHMNICYPDLNTSYHSQNRTLDDSNLSVVSTSPRGAIPRVVCKFCRKSFLASYNEEATLFAHALKHHRDHSLVQEWFNSLDVDEAQKRMPLLDIQKSLEVYNSRIVDTHSLFCGICSKGFTTLSHLLGHYTIHTVQSGVMNSPRDVSRFCSFCKKHLKRAQNYTSLVGLAAHMIESHPDKDISTFITEKQKEELSKSIPFIDYDKSVTEKRLVCILCQQSFLQLRNMITHSFVFHGPGCREAGVKVDDTPTRFLGEEFVAHDYRLAQSQSTPKRSNLNLKDHFGATESPVTTFSSDKDKWKNAFNRYGKVQTELKQKSGLVVKSIDGTKQTKLSSFMKRLEPSSTEETNILKEDSLEKSNRNVSTSPTELSDSWLQMNNTQSVITPATPALNLRNAFGSNHGSQTCENLADALTALTDKSSTSFHDTSVLSLLPAAAVDDVNTNSLPPPDLSHVPGLNGFKCRKCTYVGLKIQDIVKHTKLEHTFEPDTKPVRRDIIASCIVCSRCFANRQKLFVHIKDVHPEDIAAYPCSYCGKGFRDNKRLREHERRMHEESFNYDPSSLKCSYCSLVFLTLRNKKTHEKRHLMSST